MTTTPTMDNTSIYRKYRLHSIILNLRRVNWNVKITNETSEVIIRMNTKIRFEFD